ncbi:bacitracin ABC transporter ATP-binding protein [Paenibacillus marchantiophytorum]|uniref:Bacitracin ABC transporter ATP-binding protein n=1 Tax=Paenibacillus marchantiophytorum TaxID=1619310 RepID=A0ABQ1F725_9BACL|nr:ABC transporter ATP-binding protein [Paenibacillus marchantiophytorum]GGA01568.1 bacitracin ABC transporter ATP-binding protein [Paenibacillus marchantiophytorum]
MNGSGAAPTTVLSVKNVKKKIKNKEIIKGISFDVYAGEIFGFLGPNGSGKTTTIRMLVDLIRPTEGSIQICGFDVHKQHDQAMRQVGCIVENPELYSYLTGWENLEHFARMLPDVDQQRIQEVVEIVSMDQRIHDKVRTYSLGMRQRLGIAQALLGRPSLLILDEPTNGLDPQGIKEMREFIQRLAADGLSLFVSSHLLSEIQQMCDRVAIISHGEVIQVGAVQDLIAQGGKVIWTVSPAEQAEGLLLASPLVHAVEQVEQEASAHARTLGKPIVTQMDQEHVPALSRQLMEAGISLFAVEIKNPTLEDLFLSLTEGETIQ